MIVSRRETSVFIISLRCLGFIEPFDEGLDRHIWSLSDQSLQWDGEIARKRREKPQEVERLMRELVDAQKAVDEQEEEAFAKVSTGSMTLDGEEGEEANGGEDLAEYDGTSQSDICGSRASNLSAFAVPNEVEDISRRTFAIVDELQQVGRSLCRSLLPVADQRPMPVREPATRAF